jgi:orotidine-5'-phosphate decarboxylase
MVSPVVVALDFDSEEKVLSFVEKLNPQQCRLKVGKEIFTRCGPQLVEHLQQQGFDIFLDLKFHDIPNTVASAVAVAADLGVWMVNVHASGGRRMLEAAANVLSAYQQPPLLIGVTVLTSLVQQDLLEI